MKSTLSLLLVLKLVIQSPTVLSSGLLLNGFGTAGISCFSNDQADYVLNIQPKGPGRSKQCDAGLDSIIGIQATSEFTDNLEFTLQIVSDRNVGEDYSPELSVAQLRWSVREDLKMRIGRNQNPSFLHSESRLVHISQPWVRPPLEVYGLSPIYVFDGVEVIHQTSINHWHAEIHGGLTASDFENPRANEPGFDIVETEMAFINLLFSRNQWSYKLSLMRGEVSYSSPSIDYVLSLLPDRVNVLALEDSPFTLYSLGFSHDSVDWLMQAEMGYREVENSFFRNQFGAYVTIGRRLGNWMPYFSMAQRKTSGPGSESSLEQLLRDGSRLDTSSWSLGFAFELNDNMTVKTQVDWIQPASQSWGLYFNHSDAYDFIEPGRDELISINIDFVF